ncbi:DUF2179 domain-containing protein [bacterium]|jgi:uncharacterized protein YebE (UPF0316 family)|nr:DUF2179 domain-containing protein [bacterium]MBT5988793.1 DUF2179 domain-containing protein [bacterium]MBT7087372.1 DUF2179 domain-containing protein [bacterium]
MTETFLNSPTFIWLIVPILIFIARIINVSLGTLRIMFISSGQKKIAATIGFFEMLIWIITVGQIMQNLTNVLCYIAFAAGFPFGNIIGMKIEQKLAIGSTIIQLITQKDATKLTSTLKKLNYGITTIDAQGTQGAVKLIYIIIKRTDIQKVTKIIHQFNPKAFYTIEEVKHINEGIFPTPKSFYSRFV